MFSDGAWEGTKEDGGKRLSNHCFFVECTECGGTMSAFL